MVNAGVPLASTSYALVRELDRLYRSIFLGEIGNLVEVAKVEAARNDRSICELEGRILRDRIDEMCNGLLG